MFQVPKAGSTTWVYNMLKLARRNQTKHAVNDKAGTSSKVRLNTQDKDNELMKQTFDEMHEEMRQYYPVPKDLGEVQEKALTFHVVGPTPFILFIFLDALLLCSFPSFSSFPSTSTFAQHPPLIHLLPLDAASPGAPALGLQGQAGGRKQHSLQPTLWKG